MWRPGATDALQARQRVTLDKKYRKVTHWVLQIPPKAALVDQLRYALHIVILDFNNDDGYGIRRWIKVTSFSLQASLQQGRETPDETLHCLIVEAGAIPSPPRLDLLNAARPR